MIQNIKAINCDGDSIALNVISQSTVLDPNFVSVDEQETQIVKVFPNPATGKLIIIRPESEGLIEVFNSIGVKIMEQKSNNCRTEISLEDFYEGFYTGILSMDGIIRSFSFVVIH